jgi:hypothetical protein
MCRRCQIATMVCLAVAAAATTLVTTACEHKPDPSCGTTKGVAGKRQIYITFWQHPGWVPLKDYDDSPFEAFKWFDHKCLVLHKSGAATWLTRNQFTDRVREIQRQTGQDPVYHTLTGADG